MARTVNVTEERVELTTVDLGKAVLRDAQGQWKELRSSIDTVKNALGAVGLTVGTGAMISLYHDTLKANAALDDLAESTGATVENLSKMQSVAKIGGHDFGMVGDSLERMIKGLKGADEEGQNASAALAFLGVRAKDDNGVFRDTGAIMLEVAQKLAQYQDGANKTAIVQDIFGKGAAKLIPLLKDLAEETEANAKLTAEQAAQAELAQKNIERLKMTFEDARRELVIEFTPAIVDFTQKLLAATKASGGVAAGVALMTTAGTGDIGGRLKQIDAELKAAVAGQSGVANFFTMGGSGLLAGMNESRLLSEREYLLAVQRQQALKLGGPGSLDARDLALRQQPLNYQSPSRKGEGALPSLWTPQDEEMFQARKAAWTESERIDADFAKEDEQRAKDEQKMWQQVFKEIDDEQEREIQRGADFLKDLEDKSKRGSEAARELGFTFASAFEDAVISGKKLQDVLNGIGMDVARIILRKGVTEPAAGAIGDVLKDYLPFAGGGVMTSAGPVPLRRYAGGGVADSPQMAMFGEGDMNEAYVPLPDGRRIPVQMSGRGGHTFIIDARGADRSGMAELRTMIAKIDGSIEYRAVSSVRRASAKRGRTTPF